MALLGSWKYVPFFIVQRNSPEGSLLRVRKTSEPLINSHRLSEKGPWIYPV